MPRTTPICANEQNIPANNTYAPQSFKSPPTRPRPLVPPQESGARSSRKLSLAREALHFSARARERIPPLPFETNRGQASHNRCCRALRGAHRSIWLPDDAAKRGRASCFISLPAVAVSPFSVCRFTPVAGFPVPAATVVCMQPEQTTSKKPPRLQAVASRRAAACLTCRCADFCNRRCRHRERERQRLFLDAKTR